MKVEGFHRREDRAWYKVATLGLWVLSPWTKKKLSVLKLLGRSALKLWPKAAEREMTEAQKVHARAIAKAAALRWVRNDRERRELID